MRLGAVDADQHKSLGAKYGVRGFPTLKIFGSNKNSPSDYQGEEMGHLVCSIKLILSLSLCLCNDQVQEQQMLLSVRLCLLLGRLLWIVSVVRRLVVVVAAQEGGVASLGAGLPITKMSLSSLTATLSSL